MKHRLRCPRGSAKEDDALGGVDDEMEEPSGLGLDPRLSMGPLP
jgi:hypothetical protein